MEPKWREKERKREKEREGEGEGERESCRPLHIEKIWQLYIDDNHTNFICRIVLKLFNYDKYNIN